jgi:protein TonB
MYGNEVTRKPIRPVSSIKVKMVRMPQTKPVEKPAEMPSEQPPAVVEQPRPEIKPELPPKQKPEPEPKKPEVKQPKPEVKAPEPELVDDPPAETVDQTPALTVSGPSLAGTDSDFPFAWYVGRVEGLIARNWDPKQMGRVTSCAIHFQIAKNGSVSQVTLIRNSGVGIFDREALRAVSTTKLPPLPPQYTGRSLGVTFIFNLEPGR